MRIVYARDIATKATRWNSKQMQLIAYVGGVISTIVDRTGNMNTHKYVYDTMPTDHTTMTFADCCYEAANELWSSGKPIEVSWSGGIDSTAVLLAMMETRPVGASMGVHYTPESISEYPELYDKLIRGNFEPSPHIFDTDYYDREDLLIVSGNCGDAVFGTDIGFLKDRHDLMNKPIEEIYHWSVHKLLTRHAKESERYLILDSILEYCMYCPIEIRTIFDMYWWINFNSKWMHVQLKVPIKYAQSKNWRSHIAFYNTPNFQRWSLSNHDTKYQETFTEFKWQAKDFIHELFPDMDYRRNKEVIASGLQVQPLDDMSSNMIQLLLNDGRFWLKDQIIDAAIDKELICTM